MAELKELLDKYEIVVRNALMTVYYRQLGMISIHAGTRNMFQVCKWMSENTPYGGTLYWVVPDWLFFWDRVRVHEKSTVRFNVRFFGSGRRQMNTVVFRRGWWAMYLVPIKMLAEAMWGKRIYQVR